MIRNIFITYKSVKYERLYHDFAAFPLIIFRGGGGGGDILKDFRNATSA